MNRNYLKFALIFSVVILIVGGGYLVWDRYFSVAARQYRESKQAYENYLDIYRKDTYGGKTPQETLDMFVAALEKGDIDLASKYFMPDDNGGRVIWEEGLKKAQEGGSISEIIDIAKRAKPDTHAIIGDSIYGFVVERKDGSVEADFSLHFNGNVWKIKSL